MPAADTPIFDVKYLTKKEAAAVARISTRSIERAIASGDLPAGGTRGLVLIKRGDLDDWICRPRNGNGA